MAVIADAAPVEAMTAAVIPAETMTVAAVQAVVVAPKEWTETAAAAITAENVHAQEKQCGRREKM